VHPLDGVRAKIERGERHTATLHRELDRLFERKKPPTVALGKKFNEEESYLSVTVARVDEIPVRFGVIAGDALHNFRSALDQLIYELAFVDGGGVESKRLEKTAFPASLTVENFRSDYVQKTMLAGLTVRHRALVRPFQPYRSREADKTHDPLAMLDALSNDDKHRLTQPSLISTTGFEITIPSTVGHNCHIPMGSTMTCRPIGGKPLEKNAEVMRVPIVVTGPEPDMEMKCGLEFFVGLRNGLDISGVLEAIGKRSRAILEAFVPEFETQKALRYRDVPKLGRITPRTEATPLLSSEITPGFVFSYEP
jgi:hypothetical protein